MEAVNHRAVGQDGDALRHLAALDSTTAVWLTGRVERRKRLVRFLRPFPLLNLLLGQLNWLTWQTVSMLAEPGPSLAGADAVPSWLRPDRLTVAAGACRRVYHPAAMAVDHGIDRASKAAAVAMLAVL